MVCLNAYNHAQKNIAHANDGGGMDPPPGSALESAVTLMFWFVTFRQSGSRQLSWGLLSTKLSVNSFVTIRKLINNFRKLQGRQSP